MPAATGWTVGDARILRIEETAFSLPTATLFPTLSTPEEHPGTIALSVHSWLVLAGGRVVLVDAGIGNHKPRPSPAFDGLQTPWLERLAEAGVAPESVTDVLITHLHPDHVGWVTRLQDGQWVPTFPEARVFVPRAGYDFFRSEAGRSHRNAVLVTDSVQPAIAQVVFIEADGSPAGDALPPGFAYLPSPGHSIDHFSIRFDEAGETALFAADVTHHTLQIAAPEHSSMFCVDPAQAERSRRAMLDLATRTGALYCSSHFAAPSAGRVTQTDSGYAWRDEIS